VPILTGDAVYRQRPLREVIYQYHRDYIFQVKANYKKVPEQFPLIFSGVKQREPDDKLVCKKRGSQRFAFRNLFFAIGRWRIACIWRREEYGADKHVFWSAALGKVWTFLTGMAGAVVRLTKKKEHTLREVREQLRAKPQNARQM
jgi:hypothetical protein